MCSLIAEPLAGIIDIVWLLDGAIALTHALGSVSRARRASMHAQVLHHPYRELVEAA